MGRRKRQMGERQTERKRKATTTAGLCGSERERAERKENMKS